MILARVGGGGAVRWLPSVAAAILGELRGRVLHDERDAFAAAAAAAAVQVQRWLHPGGCETEGRRRVVLYRRAQNAQVSKTRALPLRTITAMAWVAGVQIRTSAYWRAGQADWHVKQIGAQDKRDQKSFVHRLLGS